MYKRWQRRICTLSVQRYSDVTVNNVVFLVIFDTCDVMYNWSISLLPPIVLDNLFD